jgi:[CysO sulfur-carrier protein]-S-L-cysteine hydrolase
MLDFDLAAFAAMVGHAYDGYPFEACGLLAGDAERDTITACYPCRNAARSSRIFRIDDDDYRRAEEDADRRGLSLLAIFHSHTHTEPYPSPTDVEVADGLGPWFRWVIISLKREEPEVRSYRIADGVITEEPLTVE